MLKTVITLFTTVALFSSALAQNGIDFKTSSFEDVLTLAQKENKLVFVDFYTNWSGPSKRMAANVFTQSKVGDLFNKEFVCIRVEAERGNGGPELARKYRLRAYPSYLFLDGGGNEISRSVGVLTAEELIAKGKTALEKKPK
ncbi:thioredoxin family protein [Seonamhaeicola marinus]|uniref:Thioredoxin family protein n=1 Tax=Seonamhaeicola marinus TaxID=1912246 RepID=A0A5D0HTL3_9FLAO|nr:thioredoxin family protein [Seonamhaeicola marinus]TYA74733.1 thioredoxin family protein [Seonamhaeicola marinus]